MNRIELYRTCRNIVPKAVFRMVGVVQVCERDGIRVHSKRGGGFYHDPSEVRAAAEAGDAMAANPLRDLRAEDKVLA